MPVRKFKDLPKAFKNFREDLNPNGIRRVLFLKSEWENFMKNNGVSPYYLAYRAIYMTYFVATLIIAATCPLETKAYFSLYLTNWSLITQTIYGTLFFANVFYHFLIQKCSKEDITRLNTLLPKKLNIVESVIWTLLPIVCVIPLVVSIVFWAVLYPAIIDAIRRNPTIMKKAPSCAVPSNFMVHAGNSIFAIVDLTVIAIPVHVTHFVYLLIFSMVYVFFTGFYELVHGKYPFHRDYIYPMLNWKNYPSWAVIFCFAVMFFGVILHLILWSVYILRLVIVSALLKYDVYSYHEYTYKTQAWNTPVTTTTPSIVNASVLNPSIKNDKTSSRTDLNKPSDPGELELGDIA